MKEKCSIFLEIVYNSILGYWTPIFFLLLSMFFSNNPKGDSYSVPPEDASSNIFCGFIVLCIYLFLLVPINIVAYKNKKEISLKILKILPLIFNILGIVAYFIFPAFKNGGNL